MGYFIAFLIGSWTGMFILAIFNTPRNYDE